MLCLVGATFLLSIVGSSLAGVRTVTVDDTNGDEMTGALPSYSQSPILWTVGQDCSTCLAQPVKSQVHDGTWHDTTHSEGNEPHPGQRSVSIAFVGENRQVLCLVKDET